MFKVIKHLSNSSTRARIERGPWRVALFESYTGLKTVFNYLNVLLLQY